MKNVIGAIAGLILVSVLKFGWNVITAEEVDYDDPQTQAEWLLEDDQYVLEDLANDRAAEADGWFRGEKNRTFEGDPSVMADVVQQFEIAGAPAVHVVGIEKLGGYFVSDSIAVELPPSGPEREALFRVYADLPWGDTLPDVGQRFIVLYFD